MLEKDLLLDNRYFVELEGKWYYSKDSNELSYICSTGTLFDTQVVFMHAHTLHVITCNCKCTCSSAFQNSHAIGVHLYMHVLWIRPV